MIRVWLDSKILYHWTQERRKLIVCIYLLMLAPHISLSGVLHISQAIFDGG
jgi:hypothetical protein